MCFLQNLKAKVNEMSSPKLSIIVPVYNVEQYLVRCLESLLKQSFSDYELILIDDGSKDSSGNICDEYALRDNRIKVVHQQNGGAAHARNVGIDNARGSYLTFVDSDDEVEKGTFQDNMDIIFSHSKIDILQYPEKYCRMGNCYTRKNYPSSLTLYTDKKEMFVNWYHSESIIPGGIWAKIYKRSFFDNYRFSEDIRFGEDLYCLPDIIERIRCLCVSVKGGYLYYLREGSLCNSSYTPEKRLDVCRLRIRLFQALYSFEGLQSEKSHYFVIVLHSILDAFMMNDSKNDHIQQAIRYLNNTKINISNELTLKENIWILLAKLLPLSLLIPIYIKVVRLRLKLKIKL